jgi:hypothetical protein
MKWNIRANTLRGLIWNENTAHMLPHLTLGTFTLQKNKEHDKRSMRISVKPDETGLFHTFCAIQLIFFWKGYLDHIVI